MAINLLIITQGGMRSCLRNSQIKIDCSNSEFVAGFLLGCYGDTSFFEIIGL